MDCGITLDRIAEIRKVLERDADLIDPNAVPRPYAIVDRRELYELLAYAEAALAASEGHDARRGEEG